MKSLLELFPRFRGMFFASTTVVPADGGGSGADGGGATGDGSTGSGGGATSAVGDGSYDAPGTPTETIPPGTEGGTPGEGEGAAQPTGEEIRAREQEDERAREREIRQRDSRPVLPKDISKALATLKGNPELAATARSLNDTWYRDRATFGEKGLFKDFDEARATRAVLQAVGGQDGIADLQSRSEALTRLDEDIDRGNPEIIKGMVESSPNGFKQLVAPALDALQKLDSSAYEEAIRPHLFQALEGSGLAENLNLLAEYLTQGDTDRAKNIVGAVQRWLNSQRETVERARTARPDPRLSQIEERERNVRVEEEKAFKKNITTDLMGYMNQQLEDTLEDLWKDYNLPQRTKQRLAQNAFNELSATMQGDKNYQNNANALLRTRDLNRILTYMKAKVDEVLPRAAKDIWDGFYGDVPPPRRTTPPRTATGGGNGQAAPATPAPQTQAPGQRNQNAPRNFGNDRPIMLPAKPNRDLIDWSRTNDTLFITGRAYLKAGNGQHAGKLVQWPK